MIKVIPVSNVKDIRDFPMWKFVAHNHNVTGVLFEYLISRERKRYGKTVSQLLYNFTSSSKKNNKLYNEISFHKNTSTKIIITNQIKSNLFTQRSWHHFLAIYWLWKQLLANQDLLILLWSIDIDNWTRFQF